MPALPIQQLAEVDRPTTERAEQLGLAVPVWRLTFTPLVKRTRFIERLSRLLRTLESSYRHPVDVEFTLQLNRQGEPSFNLVQCRPLATIGETGPVTLAEEPDPGRVLFRTEGHFMGGNINLTLDRVIRIDASVYSRLTTGQRYEVARLVGETVRRGEGHTLLIGPGRWGTSSPELGVPVRFADIAGVSVLVEVSEKAGDMVPDLSYGSHFFRDLVETGTAYVTLFPDDGQCRYQPGLLESASRETEPEARPENAILVTTMDDPSLHLRADVISHRLICYFGD
ncbi:MAG: PEP/pyruvate-binding domain-containing protein [Marinobacter sp.]|uniref:PEP/pyruvate-binding domain-containing protein n=1 Tax=Marinobacter sp. TaxID=50741 RepID=UPI00396D70CC